MEIAYKPIFIRQFNKLPIILQEEIYEKIDQFKIVSNHNRLKVHKLRGKFKNFYSFSVNYKYRIVFEYDTKTKVNFLGIGDHEIYN